ncbi:MAG: squalene--hopene cyclase, partial [Planctomycetaceae bacterium]
MRCFTTLAAVGCCLLSVPLLADDFQYQFEAISVPKATADEPVRGQLSVAAAAKYLEHGSAAWNGQRKCVSCHTNGTYMTIRPLLSKTLGP